LGSFSGSVARGGHSYLALRVGFGNAWVEQHELAHRPSPFGELGGHLEGDQPARAKSGEQDRPLWRVSMISPT
jgi:hypothetical protein